MAVEGKGQSQKGGFKPRGPKDGALTKHSKGKPGADAGAHKRGIKRKLTGNQGASQKKPWEKGDKPERKDQSTAQNGNDSKGPANKKRRARLERAKTRPGAEMVTRAKAIWATFRTKRMEKDEREKMAAELFELIQGNLHQLAVKHDAARVVQCALKHSNTEQRAVYFKELLEHVLDFSKIQYAHFIVLRLLDVCCTAPERKLIVRAFTNQVSSLSTHAVGAKVMEALFASWPRDEARVLRMELYGKEPMLLLPKREQSYDLKAVLDEMPERRASILTHVNKTIQRMIVKNLTGLVFVQELIWEYFCNCGPKLISEMVPNLTDVILLLTGTRAGSKVLSECAAYGSVKERKKMLKALKGYVAPTLFHKDAYLFILRLADVVDDSVAFNKTVWTELLANNADDAALLQFATHAKAYKVLVHLLAPQKKATFLNKDELALLGPALLPPHAVSAKEAREKEEAEAAKADAAAQKPDADKVGDKKKGGKPKGEEGDDAADVMLVVEEEEDKSLWVPTSKKDPEVRREEILAPLKEPLLRMCEAQALNLLCSHEGSFVLFEVARKWGKDQEGHALLKALATVAASEFVQEGEEEEEEEKEEEEEQDKMEVDGDEEDEEEGGAKEEKKKEEGKKEADKGKKAKEGEEHVGPVREHSVAYKTIKRLVLCEMDEEDPTFSRALYDEASEEWGEWLQGMRGGFLLEAMAKVKALRTELLAQLKAQHMAALKKAAAANLKGAVALLGMIEGKGEEAKGGKPNGKTTPAKKPAAGGKSTPGSGQKKSPVSGQKKSPVSGQKKSPAGGQKKSPAPAGRRSIGK